MSERRQYPRLRVLKSAKIVLGTSTLFDCVVRNLTNGGARLELPSAIDLPDVVAVTFDGGRTCRPCRLAWRRLNATGVRFLEAGIGA